MQQLAGKARMLGFLLCKIKEQLGADEAIVHRSIADDVETFNALTMPKGYLYVDPDGLCHYVFIDVGLPQADGLPEGTMRSLAGQSTMEVRFRADVIWKFEAMTGTWTIIKDRTGDFEGLRPIKCGGIPTVKTSTKTG